jgi:hypothetical protein
MLMTSRVGTSWSLGNLIDLELNLYSIESNEGVDYEHHHHSTLKLVQS